MKTAILFSGGKDSCMSAYLAKQAGYELTNNEDIAEIIIINSCIVKGKTENKRKSASIRRL